MKLILPDFICEDTQEFELECRNLSELYNSLAENNKEIADNLFENDAKPNKNVIFVMNDKIVKKGTYDKLEFDDNTVLEILLQLAGG